MKNICKIVTSFILGLLVLFCTNPAFAQDENSDTNNTIVRRSEISAESNTQVFISSKYADKINEWEKDSKIYKGVGWGMFGFGMALGIAGTVVMVHAKKDYESDDPKNSGNDHDYDYVEAINRYDKNAAAVKAGYALLGVGSAFIITGIALLIADAVKFGPYRRGEVVNGFSWQPELYATPELAGFGISGRF